MRGLLSRLLLDQTASWGAVIIVGAGSCSEWPQLSRLAALRFVLVEPQPRLFDELAGQTRSARGWSVFPLPGCRRVTKPRCRC